MSIEILDFETWISAVRAELIRNGFCLEKHRYYVARQHYTECYVHPRLYARMVMNSITKLHKIINGIG